jgi:predicted metal-dependent phosphoesterase TrpH
VSAEATSAALPFSTRYDGQQRLDLHTHSTASDGVYAPGNLVRLASVVGLNCIALTDHDSTEGVDEAIAAGEQVGLTVIPGIEINTDLPKGQGEAHLLGYFIAREEPAFQATLRFLREARAQRGERIVAKLRAAGVEISWERVREIAHGAVGRPHVAQALIEAGYAQNMQDAFDRYLVPGKSGYLPRFRLPAKDAVRLIRSAFGVPVLAHPAGIPGLEERRLPALVAVGLQGLECYYGRYDDATVERLVGLANHHGLIPTGGSDYHGPDIHPTPLGSRYVPTNAAALLREAARRNQSEPAIPFAIPEAR